MIRSAIIILLVNYCAALFSQNLTFSERFESHKKNAAIEVVNTHPHYFYVIRYNKDAHDFLLERRAKPQGRILALTRLKLDSINADWFDYTKLEYLVFEHEAKLYFIFEKELNSRKEIFFKTIDTSGKSSGFIPVAVLEKDKTTENVRFLFQLTHSNRLLIIAEKYGLNYDVRKTVTLYDPIKRIKIWTRVLSPETESTGFTSAFECGPDDNLYFVQIRSRAVDFRRKFINHMQTLVPVYFYDFIILHRISNDSALTSKVKLPLENLSALYSVNLKADHQTVTASIHFAVRDSLERDNVLFLTSRITADLSSSVYNSVTPLEPRLKKQLTFYDGSDFKNPADKHYRFRNRVNNGSTCYITGERIDGNYYKEMLLWRTDFNSGRILNQEIIPRRSMFYDDIGRRSNTTQLVYQNTLYTLLLEDKDNLEMGARDFRYHDFYELSFHDDCNLVAYVLYPNGNFEKKLIFDNEDFRYLPIRYQSSQEDFVFCIKRGRQERFVILKLNPSS